MGGGFAFRSVEIYWTFHEDGAGDDGDQWVFKVTLGDISVTRQYPNVTLAGRGRKRSQNHRAGVVPHCGGVAEVVLCPADFHGRWRRATNGGPGLWRDESQNCRRAPDLETRPRPTSSLA